MFREHFFLGIRVFHLAAASLRAIAAKVRVELIYLGASVGPPVGPKRTGKQQRGNTAFSFCLLRSKKKSNCSDAVQKSLSIIIMFEVAGVEL